MGPIAIDDLLAENQRLTAQLAEANVNLEKVMAALAEMNSLNESLLDTLEVQQKRFMEQQVQAAVPVAPQPKAKPCDDCDTCDSASAGECMERMLVQKHAEVERLRTELQIAQAAADAAQKRMRAMAQEGAPQAQPQIDVPPLEKLWVVRGQLLAIQPHSPEQSTLRKCALGWLTEAITELTDAPQAQPMTCPYCGTHEVALLLECHNSACAGYAESLTVYTGWQAGAKATGANHG
jgi:hypothetical protein